MAQAQAEPSRYHEIWMLLLPVLMMIMMVMMIVVVAIERQWWACDRSSGCEDGAARD